MARRVLGEVNGAILSVDEGADGKRTSVILDASKASKRVRVKYAVAGAVRAFDGLAKEAVKAKAIESVARLAKTTELVRNPTTGRLVEIETGPLWRFEGV